MRAEVAHTFALTLLTLALLFSAAAAFGAPAPLPPPGPAQAAIAPSAAGQTTVSTTTITLPTHPVEQALSYMVNPTYNMPYARLDRSKYDGSKLVKQTTEKFRPRCTSRRPPTGAGPDPL